VGPPHHALPRSGSTDPAELPTGLGPVPLLRIRELRPVNVQLAVRAPHHVLPHGDGHQLAPSRPVPGGKSQNGFPGAPVKLAFSAALPHHVPRSGDARCPALCLPPVPAGAVKKPDIAGKVDGPYIAGKRGGKGGYFALMGGNLALGWGGSSHSVPCISFQLAPAWGMGCNLAPHGAVIAGWCGCGCACGCSRSQHTSWAGGVKVYG